MFKWFGKVPEWLNGAFSKNVVSLKNTEGSNPSFSANQEKNDLNSKLKLLKTSLYKLAILLENYREWWASIILTILASSFFLIISTPQIFQNVQFFQQRWFGLSVVIVSVLFIWISTRWKRWSRWHSFSVWIQGSVVLLYAFAYFIRLNQSQLSVIGINVNTSIVFIPLTLLIFVVMYNLYRLPTLPKPSLLAIILLLFLQSFSIFSFIKLDRTGSRDFSQDWVANIFEINPFYLILLTTTLIAIISVINIKLEEVKLRLLATLVFFFMIFATIVVIYALPFNYWYKTLLALVTWDFLYRPLKQIFNGVNDSKFGDKLGVSVGYHGFLAITILIVGIISNI